MDMHCNSSLFYTKKICAEVISLWRNTVAGSVAPDTGRQTAREWVSFRLRRQSKCEESPKEAYTSQPVID